MTRLALRVTSSPIWYENSMSMVPSAWSLADPELLTASISSKFSQVKNTKFRAYSKSRPACMAPKVTSPFPSAWMIIISDSTRSG